MASKAPESRPPGQTAEVRRPLSEHSAVEGAQCQHQQMDQGENRRKESHGRKGSKAQTALGWGVTRTKADTRGARSGRVRKL